MKMDLRVKFSQFDWLKSVHLALLNSIELWPGSGYILSDQDLILQF